MNYVIFKNQVNFKSNKNRNVAVFTRDVTLLDVFTNKRSERVVMLAVINGQQAKERIS